MQNKDVTKEVKKIIFHYLSYYKLFGLTVFIFLVFVYFYNKTLTPIYENSAKIHLIKKDITSSLSEFNFETSIAASQMGMRYGMGMDDEISLLKSFSTIRKTIEQLEYEITYFKKDTIFPQLPVLKNKYNIYELHKYLPFKIRFDASHPQTIYQEFTINKVSDSTFSLKSKLNNGSLFNYIDNEYIEYNKPKTINIIANFNTLIETDFLKFSVNKTDYFKWWKKGDQIIFVFENPEIQTLTYRNKISIEQKSPSSFIFIVSMQGTNFEKITEFVNRFTENILEDDLEQKNTLAISTVNFINSQLGSISDSLDVVKSNLARFRSTNKVTDLSFQGQRLYDQISKIEEDKASLQMQERYYEYLIGHLESNSKSKELVSPASMNVVDPLLNNMISQLSALYNQFNNYSQSSSSSIYLNDLKIKIRNQENAILENAKNNLSTIQLSMNELNYRIEKVNKEISNLPKTELKLFDIEREFKLNDAVLTFLMQKRSEAQIAMASTNPSYQIIEPARALFGNPVAPKTSFNYIIAFVLGIFLPLIYILVKDFLDNKVREKSDIIDIDKYTFLGSIHKSTNPNPLCVIEQPDSVISESFRAVRTNLQFMIDYSDSRIISVTSSSSGEGKSFLAVNLAATYAMSNLKTVLLEFDLRRPKVGKYFGVQDPLGLTSYLSDNANLNDITIKVSNIGNIDVILAGSPAPNPAELIASKRTSELLEYLKTVYDIIIIDTAPVGIVSESFHLMKNSDLNMFVIRQDYSFKDLVNQTLEDVDKTGVNKLSIVMNGVGGKSISRYKQSSYRKYYIDEQNKKRFSFFNFRKG